MPAPRIEMSNLKNGIARYKNPNDRPWLQTLNRVDWFISIENDLYPLKYTYALSINQPPADYTTNQMKSAMKHLNITFHSLKAEIDEEAIFQKKVAKSLKYPKDRAKRLLNANQKPSLVRSYSLSFKRNPDVVAQVLDRANGKCESCGADAPFKRLSDCTPYLEVHHIVFLSNAGLDSVENSEALCPNCHRQKHFG